MKQNNRKPPGKGKGINIGKLLFTVFIIITLMACFSLTVFAEEASGVTIWDKATEIMKDVYDQVLLISTVAAVVTASVALLLMNFSRSGKTVDESRACLSAL